ncbi:MAG: hypothetical protein KatS3mg023_0590 [Armatimonadota bacterium]|nr:MAG: hypothetical protein KatS3mg023_0590 [Armatimonadota bacterium]
MKKLLKPFIIRWLDERALRLPYSVRQRIADRLKVDTALVFAVEEAIREHIIQQVKEW